MTRQFEQTSSQPKVNVQFSHLDRRYQQNENLLAHYEILDLSGSQVKAIEQSVVWYTEGKGEEDLGVHFFQRVEEKESTQSKMVTGSFQTDLPASPLSYEGIIVKVRWCVRIRMFFLSGKDFVSEHVFEMGSIPPAHHVISRKTEGVEV